VKGYTDAVIRVWDKNTGALNLYKKQGFSEIAEIIQEKIQQDGMTVFQMNKIYLHKKFTI
jgi:ribosomal protein S18 acetylase RimI-like enzyme